MNAFALGQLTGVLLLVVFVPSVVAGFFSNRKPSGQRMLLGWITAIAIAGLNVTGGGPLWMAIAAIAVLAGLTWARYASWRG